MRLLHRAWAVQRRRNDVDGWSEEAVASKKYYAESSIHRSEAIDVSETIRRMLDSFVSTPQPASQTKLHGNSDCLRFGRALDQFPPAHVLSI